MPCVSVIIPVYNTAPYLQRCLESVCNQTLKNIEIICVNDGSTDNSKEILQQYKDKDNRICVITQEHKGIAAARNVGLQCVTGQYIGFVDSDDWIEPDMFELAYTTAQREHVDIVAWAHYLELTGRTLAIVDESSAGIHEREKALCYALSEKIYRGFLWNKLFSYEIILKGNKGFEESFLVLEDQVFVCEKLLLTDKLFYIPVLKYHYCRNQGSTYWLSEQSESMFIASKYLVNLIAQTTYKQAKRYAKAWYCYSAGALFLYYASKTGKSEKKKAQFYYQEQKRYLKEYLWVYKTWPQKLMRGILIACFPWLAIKLKNK